MSELQIIQDTLERAARRRRGERALRGLWRGLLVGAASISSRSVVFKLAPVPHRHFALDRARRPSLVRWPDSSSAAGANPAWPKPPAGWT